MLTCATASSILCRIDISFQEKQELVKYENYKSRLGGNRFCTGLVALILLSGMTGLPINQTAPEMLSVRTNLHIVKAGSFDTLTVIEMRWTNTVYSLKEETQRYLGHDIWSQGFDVCGSPMESG
ncbi:hypothetical protein M0R45_037396 [Rubus argutus]|uniref:Uncharacterized protein n=1 Tax=Rubus argutus TaxID=59490 RepID=A0AAW1W4C7_RUBAR